jgi:hypothetical protein
MRQKPRFAGASCVCGRPCLAPRPFDRRSGDPDLAQAAALRTLLRVSLFGERNPFGPMHHFGEITNPFPTLRAAAIPEEALRPVARLLLSEILVTERGVLIGSRASR